MHMPVSAFVSSFNPWPAPLLAYRALRVVAVADAVPQLAARAVFHHDVDVLLVLKHVLQLYNV